jgi:sterol desaturase/sphingolipid hydroxylase (fatty acid hydroxylase superfamily)
MVDKMRSTEELSWNHRCMMSLILMLIGFFLLLLLVEVLFPLRHRTRILIRRLIMNLCISVFAIVVAAFIVRPVGLSLAAWTAEKSFGLLHIVALPAAVRFTLAFLLMDLTFYYWHLANHMIPGLWRFHNVHHIDPDLDVSTALRFHVGEVLLSAGFRAVQVGLIGLPPLTYMIYESVFQGSTLFHHSNVRLPLQAERLLNKILVTPRMHGIHHSVVQNETNSNYSVVFPWWDRLHSSLRLDIPQAAIVIGVPAYHEPVDNTLWNVLSLPFRRQRDYWRWPDGSRPMRDTAETGDARTLMRE